MKAHKLWLSKLTTLIMRVNEQLDAGKHLSRDQTIKEVEGGAAMEWLFRNIDLSGPRFSLDILDKNDIATLNEHFQRYSYSTEDYWPIQNNGLCFYVAWTTELIAQEEWSTFSDPLSEKE